MPTLKDIDLEHDPQASRYVKSEIVTVIFATENGQIASREGANHYAIGDALITGSTGDHWSVTRDRFDAKYSPVAPLIHGENGSYANRPLAVFAKQMFTSFSVQRSNGGDVIYGNAHDWLMQYAPGDYGIVENAKFKKVYRPLST